jgi:predicted Zn-dependent protease
MTSVQVFDPSTPHDAGTRSIIRRVVLLLGVVLLAMPMVGCNTNAATGRNQLVALSRAEEIAIGEDSAPKLTAEYGGVVDSPDARAYLTAIGQDLASHTESDNPSLPWEFTLLDSDVINAFALPGGKVFVSRGLVELFENEAELAFVVGHEIGHVTARHASEAVARQQGLQIGSTIVGIGAQILTGAGGVSSQVVSLGSQALISGAGLFALSYDRAQELESDKLGMRYMVRAGYDPAGAAGAMEVLVDAAGGSASSADIFSTHPNPVARLEAIKDRIERVYPGAVGNPEFEVDQQEFERRMLRPLASLPWPRHTGGPTTTHAWCLHCAGHPVGGVTPEDVTPAVPTKAPSGS